MTQPTIERRAAAGVLARGRTLYGHAAIFGQETRIGTFTERIAPGAFAKTLASGRDILALLDHRPDALLGRTQAARDVVTLAERGDLGGMSFGFIATDEVWHGDTRELRGLELHEISVVQAWPAYAQTEVSLRHRPVGPNDALALHRAWFETL